MTDEEKIALVRLLIGDIPSSPFYPLFEDEQIQQFLNQAGGDVIKASKYAAISASFILASASTRERTGDIEVWSSAGTNYLAALKLLLSNSSIEIPNGLMPWAGGISRAEICKYALDPDIPRSKLLDIYLCDSDRPCGPPSFCGC